MRILHSSLLVLAMLPSCIVQTETGFGETGPAGETGPQGETGPEGQTGLQGEAGPQGETGPEGQAGSQGEAGVSPFYYVDESTTDIAYDGGKVGIGPATPNALLALSSATPDALRLNITALNAAYGENGALTWQGYYSGTTTRFDAIAIKRFNLDDSNGSANKQRLGLFVREPVVDGTLLERLTVRENGYVGIGTTDPWTNLTVLNPTQAVGEQRIASFRRQRTGTGTDGLDIFDDGAGDGGFATSTVRLKATGTDSCNLGLGPTGAELLITTAGSVGIGTAVPRATLDINGTARLAKNYAPPTPCTSLNDGTIALNSAYQMCVCNGSSWIYTHNGSGCTW